MKQRWLQLKFIWEYATHLQTDSNPPLDLIFKFIYGLDKKDIIKNFNKFSKTETSKKVFEAEVDVIDKIKTGTFKPGTFGHEFQTWFFVSPHHTAPRRSGSTCPGRGLCGRDMVGQIVYV